MEVGVAQLRRVAGEAHVGIRELVRVDLARAIRASSELVDSVGVRVESDDRRPPAERDRDRESDVPEPDDRDVSPVRHHRIPWNHLYQSTNRWTPTAMGVSGR